MPSRIEATPNSPGTWMMPSPRISMCSRVMGTAEPWMAPVLSRVSTVVSSATRLWPRLISARAISLLPMPGSPFQQHADAVDFDHGAGHADARAGQVLHQHGAAFMKWPVTRCVRMTGTCSSANTFWK
jgi:hypothetical protein